MLTKQQKIEQVDKIVKDIKASQGLLYVDFAKVPISGFTVLRRLLKSKNAKLKIAKKRLLKIAFDKIGVATDPTQFAAQTGIIFVDNDILDIASDVYKFVKEMTAAKKVFTVLGGFDLKKNIVLTAEEFLILAQLPNRETLLTQIAFMLAMPIRQLAFSLNQIVENKK